MWTWYSRTRVDAGACLRERKLRTRVTLKGFYRRRSMNPSVYLYFGFSPRNFLKRNAIFFLRKPVRMWDKVSLRKNGE